MSEFRCVRVTEDMIGEFDSKRVATGTACPQAVRPRDEEVGALKELPGLRPLLARVELLNVER